jgi:prepilin-type processing-associated H-X9-DG protein
VLELVVVIAIIVIVLGLLLPSVQGAREAARRIECSSRLKQLGIASALHHDVHGRLPSGTLLADSETPFRSWHSQLLPFLEEQSLDHSVLQSYEGLKNPFQPLYHPGFSHPNALFACPSDPYGSEAQFVQSYGVWAGFTSFLGVTGENSDKSNGVLFGNSRIRYSEIQDGLSTTLLAGERPASFRFHYGWWYAGVGDGTGVLDHTLGMAETAVPVTGECEADAVGLRLPDRPRNGCDARYFWSFHPEGADFLYCDGAVRFHAYTTSPIALLARSTRQ